jgi:hypothetical protein
MRDYCTNAQIWINIWSLFLIYMQKYIYLNAKLLIGIRWAYQTLEAISSYDAAQEDDVRWLSEMYMREI